jgi:WD40 repeat protein
MTKAFVSYSRKDTDFTRKLTDALLEKGMELWVDWKNIPPTVDWKLQIQKGVEEADTFLFLISPDSVKSGECAEEIVHAVNNNKRIITLLVRKLETELPPSLNRINWIDFSKEDCFDESFMSLLEAINTDYEWVQTHSRLQVKALEWERSKKDQSLLLRGMELENMEGQLLVNSSKEPIPTEIQGEYVLESKKAKEAERKAKAKQQRIITIASAVVSVVMIILSVWAVNNAREANIQRKEAQKQESIAKANEKKAQENEKKANDNATLAKIGEISALAVGRIEQDYNEALLYSVEAYRHAEETGFNQESAKTALLTTLQSRHGLIQVLPGHTDWITSLVYSQDGNTIASSSWDHVTYLWDATDAENPRITAKIEGDDVAISSDNRVAATASFDTDQTAKIVLWDISSRSNPAQLGTLTGTSIVDFTPNNNYIIVIKDENETTENVQVWDISNFNDPRLVTSLDGRNAYLSPLGSYLVLMSEDENFNTIFTLWDFTDPQTPSLLAPIPGNYYSNPASQKQLAFSTDENILAVSGEDDAGNAITRIWGLSNPSLPQELSTLSGTSDQISSLAISPDNTFLALGGSDGKIFVWDIIDPENPTTYPSLNYFTGHTLLVSQIAFNPAADTFVTGSLDGNLMLWDVKLSNPIQITAPKGNQLAASWNGKLVASQSYNPETESFVILLWDVSEPYKPVQVGELPGYASYAYFNPNGNSIVTVSPSFEEGTPASVSLWDITNPAFPVEHKLMDIPQTFNNSFTFNTEGNALVITDNYQEITTLWDLSDLNKPEQFGLVEQYVNAMAFSPDNRLLAIDISNQKSETIFWDISKPGQYTQTGTLNGYGVAFSPDGTRFALGTEDKSGNSVVQVWDIATWKKKVPLTTVDGYTPVFNQKGNLLVTRIAPDEEGEAEDLFLWDITNPTEPKSQRLTGHTKDIQSVAISSNDQLLASASSDKTIMVWDISNPAMPKKLTTLNGHSDWVMNVTFSPNDLTLASGSYDGGVILWDMKDIKNIRQIGKLSGHTSIITSIQFPEDGKTLLTADMNKTILWDIDPESWIIKACNMAGSNFTQEQWSRLSLGEYHTTCSNPEMLAFDPFAQSAEIVPVASTETTTTDTTTSLPLCTETDAAFGCPLATWNPTDIENERDRFCIDTVSYTLYALPEGTTLTPIDEGFTCTNEGVRGGFQMYTCYSLEHPNTSFQANMCNAGCQVSQSDQCESGLGLDSSQSCCAPVSTDGCYEVTLEIGTCTQ